MTFWNRKPVDKRKTLNPRDNGMIEHHEEKEENGKEDVIKRVYEMQKIHWEVELRNKKSKEELGTKDD
tara:strand:+ start:7426 stop:7629 length:204 start_codon:yes stop_codon:yes gene_type:complete